jgi:hypothetical protein
MPTTTFSMFDIEQRAAGFCDTRHDLARLHCSSGGTLAQANTARRLNNPTLSRHIEAPLRQPETKVITRKHEYKRPDSSCPKRKGSGEVDRPQ